MARPAWITKGGQLGILPELDFVNIPLEVTNPENDIITFSLTSGELPPGMQIIASPGSIQGVPVVLDPIEVDEAREYRFTVRAKARSSGVVIDRSFSISVTNLYPPYIIPRTSDLGYVFDGTYYTKTLTAIEPNPNAKLKWRILSGDLPTGLTLTEDGVIEGYVEIQPVGQDATGAPGYDTNNYLGVSYFDTGSYDSVGRSTNKQYTFTIEVTDGSNFDNLTYALNVASKGSFTADQGDVEVGSTTGIGASLTCDNDDLTIDHDNRYVPIITTLAQSLPTVRQENYFAYKFDAIDFEGDELTWVMQVAEGGSYDQGGIDVLGWGSTKPRTVIYVDTDTFELSINIDTSQYPEGSTYDVVGAWYESDSGEVTLLEEGVDFNVSSTQTTVDFLTPAAVPDNGRAAIDFIINTPDNVQSGAGGFDEALFDQSESKLPPTLLIDDNGWLNGYVEPQVEDIKEYNFIVTTYKTDDPTYESNPVQFNLTILGSLTDIITWTTPSDLGSIIPGEVSQLTVEAVSSRGQEIFYSIAPKSKLKFPNGLSLNVLENGYISGRTTFRGYRLDAGNTTFDKNKTYFDNKFELTVVATTADGLTSSEKTFSLRIEPRYTRPYENLYMKALPTQEQRELFLDIINNQDIFPDSLIYRKEDPWFGKAKTVKFLALAGINPTEMVDYISAMQNNHYTKVVNFGNIKTARAVDEFYNTEYEVVYVEIDDPFNRNDALVPAEIPLGQHLKNYGSQFFIDLEHSHTINPYIDQQGNEYLTVYPNTFANMNQRIIENLGYSARGVYPKWMLSVQEDKTIIGYKRAVVLAYTIPGASKLIAYRLKNSGFGFSKIDFTVDRYQLDNVLTDNFDITNNQFIESSETTFDRLVVGPGERQLAVTYAVEQSFESIHLRSKNYINSNQLANPSAGPGIDGIKNFRHGDTLVFAQQENFNNVTDQHDGWVDYQNLFVGDIPGDGDDTELATEGGTRLGSTLSGPNSIWNFTNGTITIQATGLPYHSYGTAAESNIIAEQNYLQRWPNHAGTNYTDPAHPKVPAGIIGYWLNGVAMYNPTDGNSAPIGYEQIAGSEYISASSASQELGYSWGEDAAGGHANGYNRYHYHDFHFGGAWGSGIGAVSGSVGVAETSVIPYLSGGLTHPDGHSKILGFTLDGYPVYGPYGYIDPADPAAGVRRMETSYSIKPDYSHRDGLVNDPVRYPLGMFVEDFEFDDHGTLDRHNGRFAVTPDYPNGTYAYYTTVDIDGTPVFPYVIGPTWYGYATGAGINNLTNGLGYAPAGTDLISNGSIVNDYDSVFGFDSYKVIPGYRERGLTVLNKLLVSETPAGSANFDIDYQFGSNLIGKAILADSGIPANTKIIQQQTVDTSSSPGVVNLVTRVVTNNECQVKLSAGSTIQIVNALEAAQIGLGNTVITTSIPDDLKIGMSIQGVNILENTYIVNIDRDNNQIITSQPLTAVKAGDVIRYLQSNQRAGIWRVNISGTSSLVNYDTIVDYAVKQRYNEIHGQAFSTMMETFENGIDGEIDWRVLNGKTIILLDKDMSSNSWELDDTFDLEAYDTAIDPALLQPVPPHLRREVYQINIIETYKPIEKLIKVNGKSASLQTEKIVKLTRVNETNFPVIDQSIRIRIRTGEEFGGKDYQLDYTNNFVTVPAIVSDELVRLEFVQEVEIGTKVKVAAGLSHGFSFMTYDATLGADQTVPKYKHWKSSIEAESSDERRNYTRFDGGGTRFFNNRDVYHVPEDGDKYLKFPQLGVFT